MNAPFAPRRRASVAPLLRFALRDLRGGLAGLRIVILCVALGVAAIVGVNSLARSLEAGLGRDGRTILGGDASFSLIHRELAPDERAYLASRGAIIDLLFAARARSGSTLVLVTHDPALAGRCDRTLRMRSGHLEAEAPAPVEA